MHVGSASRLVAEAAAKLELMAEAVAENLSLVGGIASASRAQAASFEEVTAAVRQMDEMTQHNAALVEEMNAAIEKTENQANELDGIVDIFKFSASDNGETALSAPFGTARGPARRRPLAPLRTMGNAALKQDYG